MSNKELSRMPCEDVFRRAIKEGLSEAMTLVNSGKDSKAVQAWYTQHPQFGKRRISTRLCFGQMREKAREIRSYYNEHGHPQGDVVLQLIKTDGTRKNIKVLPALTNP